MKNRIVRNLVGPQVRRLRCARAWSQEKLLSKLQDQGWRICRAHLARLEACEVWVGDFELVLVARTLQVPSQNLLPEIEEKKPLYEWLSERLKGQIKTLMSPDDILIERSRALLRRVNGAG